MESRKCSNPKSPSLPRDDPPRGGGRRNAPRIFASDMEFHDDMDPRRPIPKFGESWAKAHTFGVQGFRRELINLSGAEDEIYPNGQQSFIAGFYHSEAEAGPVGTGPPASAARVGDSFPVWSAIAARAAFRGVRPPSRPTATQPRKSGPPVGRADLQMAATLVRCPARARPAQSWVPNKSGMRMPNGIMMAPGLEWSGGLFAQSYESFIGLNPVWENGQWIYEYSAGDAQLFGSEWLVHTHQGTMACPD